MVSLVASQFKKSLLLAVLLGVCAPVFSASASQSAASPSKLDWLRAVLKTGKNKTHRLGLAAYANPFMAQLVVGGVSLVVIVEEIIRGYYAQHDDFDALSFPAYLNKAVAEVCSIKGAKATFQQKTLLKLSAYLFAVNFGVLGLRQIPAVYRVLMNKWFPLAAHQGGQPVNAQPAGADGNPGANGQEDGQVIPPASASEACRQETTGLVGGQIPQPLSGGAARAITAVNDADALVMHEPGASADHVAPGLADGNEVPLVDSVQRVRHHTSGPNVESANLPRAADSKLRSWVSHCPNGSASPDAAALPGSVLEAAAAPALDLPPSQPATRGLSVVVEEAGEPAVSPSSEDLVHEDSGEKSPVDLDDEFLHLTGKNKAGQRFTFLDRTLSVEPCGADSGEGLMPPPVAAQRARSASEGDKPRPPIAVADSAVVDVVPVAVADETPGDTGSTLADQSAKASVEPSPRSSVLIRAAKGLGNVLHFRKPSGSKTPISFSTK